MKIWWIKFLLSFLKKDWNLNDYPVHVKQNKINLNGSSIAKDEKPKSWFAIIEKWYISGVGETREAALKDLEKNFLAYKKRNTALPRPGTLLPIPQTPTTMISQHPALVAEFMETLFELSPGDYFISDRSNLSDFEFCVGDMDFRDYQRKIALVYRVDVSDIEDGNLAEIIARIHQSRKEKHA